MVKHESEISELAELDDMERERYARAELEDEIPIEIGKEPPTPTLVQLQPTQLNPKCSRLKKRVESTK